MALVAVKTFCDAGDRMREKLAEQDELVEELERRLRKAKAKAAELRRWVEYADNGTETMLTLMSEVARNNN
jgi:ribosome-associated translation inhibitor RaiA